MGHKPPLSRKPERRAAPNDGVPPRSRIRVVFTGLASHAAVWVGSPWAFLIALAGVLAWAVTGPRFHYSDTWQLIVNTSTTIVTFLMVFLIQHTQNRDTLAVQLKLNELIAAVGGASNELIDIERLSEEELQVLRTRFARLLAKIQSSGLGHEHHSVAETKAPEP